MLQFDQFRLPIGFKFTKRLWSHQNFKRRTDFSMRIEWSNKEYYYSIQVNSILLRKQFLVRDSLFPKISSFNLFLYDKYFNMFLAQEIIIKSIMDGIQ